MKSTLLHRLEYLLARFFFWLFGVLPYRVVLALVWPLARLAWLLASRIRKRTLRRFRQVFGDTKTAKQIEKEAWIAFRNLAFLAVETIRVPRLTREWVDAHMDTPSVEVLHTIRQTGHGVIIAVPHMGSWELAGAALAYRGFPVLTFFRKQKNPYMTEWLYQTRAKFGLHVIDVHSREIAKLGRQMAANNSVLVVTPDLRAKTGGYPVRFLGHETLIPSGAAHYARVAQCPVVTAEVYRIGWTRHAWRQTGLIHPDSTLPAKEDGQRMTQYIMDRFTESVQAHPECYFWFNSRWVLGPEKK